MSLKGLNNILSFKETNIEKSIIKSLDNDLISLNKVYDAYLQSSDGLDTMNTSELFIKYINTHESLTNEVKVKMNNSFDKLKDVVHHLDVEYKDTIKLLLNKRNDLSNYCIKKYDNIENNKLEKLLNTSNNILPKSVLLTCMKINESAVKIIRLFHSLVNVEWKEEIANSVPSELSDILIGFNELGIIIPEIEQLNNYDYKNKFENGTLSELGYTITDILNILRQVIKHTSVMSDLYSIDKYADGWKHFIEYLDITYKDERQTDLDKFNILKFNRVCIILKIIDQMLLIEKDILNTTLTIMKVFDEASKQEISLESMAGIMILKSNNKRFSNTLKETFSGLFCSNNEISNLYTEFNNIIKRCKPPLFKFEANQDFNFKESEVEQLEPYTKLSEYSNHIKNIFYNLKKDISVINKYDLNKKAKITENLNNVLFLFKDLDIGIENDNIPILQKEILHNNIYYTELIDNNKELLSEQVFTIRDNNVFVSGNMRELGYNDRTCSKLYNDFISLSSIVSQENFDNLISMLKNNLDFLDTTSFDNDKQYINSISHLNKCKFQLCLISALKASLIRYQESMKQIFSIYENINVHNEGYPINYRTSINEFTSY